MLMSGLTVGSSCVLPSGVLTTLSCSLMKNGIYDKNWSTHRPERRQGQDEAEDGRGRGYYWPDRRPNLNKVDGARLVLVDRVHDQLSKVVVQPNLAQRGCQQHPGADGEGGWRVGGLEVYGRRAIGIR